VLALVEAQPLWLWVGRRTQLLQELRLRTSSMELRMTWPLAPQRKSSLELRMSLRELELRMSLRQLELRKSSRKRELRKSSRERELRKSSQAA
jgi:hypothetical protein